MFLVIVPMLENGLAQMTLFGKILVVAFTMTLKGFTV
jgi:hypothetical protein